MYTSKPHKQASITVDFIKYAPDASINTLIFNAIDDKSLHVLDDNNGGFSICKQTNVDRNECSTDDINKIIVRGNLSTKILNNYYQVKDSKPSSVNYTVEKTGYYCTLVYSRAKTTSNELVAQLTFVNSFGLIPAIEYPKLPFYGFLTVVYLGITIAWIYAAYKYWTALLTIQHIITGVVAFIFVEHAFMYSYYRFYNIHGYPCTIIIYLI
jgi:hypothetical protein